MSTMSVQQFPMGKSKSVSVVAQTKKTGFVAGLAELFGHVMTEERRVGLSGQALEPLVGGRVLDVHVEQQNVYQPTQSPTYYAPDTGRLRLARYDEEQTADILPPHFNAVSAAPALKADVPGGRGMGAGSVGAVPVFNSASDALERQSTLDAKAAAAEEHALELESAGLAWEESFDAPHLNAA